MKTTIFLDIDGVLSTYKEYDRVRKKFWNKYDLAGRLKIPYPFNPKCVEVFNEILELTDADIVLSSDWRLHWTLEELGLIFKFNNVIKSPIDTTGNVPVSFGDASRNRASDIGCYVDEHKIERYIIIDDLDLERFVPIEKFVKTTDREGIKQTSIKEKIIKILQDGQE